jgi:hypothetical protein
MALSSSLPPLFPNRTARPFPDLSSPLSRPPSIVSPNFSLNDPSDERADDQSSILPSSRRLPGQRGSD